MLNTVMIDGAYATPVPTGLRGSQAVIANARFEDDWVFDAERGPKIGCQDGGGPLISRHMMKLISPKRRLLTAIPLL